MTDALVISTFRGPYRFLSNYYEAPIILRGPNMGPDGIIFPTNEHAFAALKTLDVQMRRDISRLKTPGDAKAAGRSKRLVPLNGDNERARLLVFRNDWESIKLRCMWNIVVQKFSQHNDLREKLLNTGDALLIEGTSPSMGWVDTTWGVNLDTGKGLNRLGRILMLTRSLFAEVNKPGAIDEFLRLDLQRTFQKLETSLYNHAVEMLHQNAYR